MIWGFGGDVGFVWILGFRFLVVIWDFGTVNSGIRIRCASDVLLFCLLFFLQKRSDDGGTRVWL